MMMMTTKVCTLAAIFVLCTMIRPSSAHTFFAANLTDAALNGYTHSGNFYYNLTSATLPNNTSAKLVVGNPLTDGNDTITVVSLQGPFSPTSTAFLASEEGEPIDPPAFGEFGPQDISPAAAATFNTALGGIYDVFQVACQGNLYLVLETKNKTPIYAPLNYVPSMHSPDKTCAQATMPYVAAAPTGAPSSDGNRSTIITTAFLIVASILGAFY